MTGHTVGGQRETNRSRSHDVLQALPKNVPVPLKQSLCLSAQKKTHLVIPNFEQYALSLCTFILGHQPPWAPRHEC